MDEIGALAVQLRTQAALPPPVLGHPTVSTVDLGELWEASWARLSAHTRRAYDGDLRAFAAYLGAPTGKAALFALIAGGPGAANLTALRWQNTMRESGLAPKTRNRRMTALRAALKLCRKAGLCAWAIEVEGEQAEVRRDTRGPSEDQYRAMRDGAAVRDRAILRLLHDLALRRGAVAALDVSDLDLDAGRIAVLEKGHAEKERRTLPPETADALRQWLDLRGTAPGPLFLSHENGLPPHRLSGEAVHDLVKRAGLRVGVQGQHPHGLRHRAITKALERGASIRAAQRFANHADPKTTMQYDDDRQDLAGQIARLVARD